MVKRGRIHSEASKHPPNPSPKEVTYAQLYNPVIVGV